MTFRQPAAPPLPASPAERRSCRVFATVLGLVLLAVGFPELPTQVLLGLLWVVVGGLMLLWPPEIRVPRWWWVLAAGFIGLAMAGFLPRNWDAIPGWRGELEALGLDTGPCLWVQPLLAAETLAGFAMTALVGLFLFGHRVGTRIHHRLLLGFAMGVALWTLVALLCHEPGRVFGFFPNRNHSATLLAMGVFAGLGSLTQAIRFREGGKIAMALLPVGLCLYTLFAVSESRGGMVLVVAGFLIWLPLLGWRQLRGNVGKAVALLLLAAIGVFVMVDTKAKSRLAATVERIEIPALTAPTPKLEFVETAPAEMEVPLDGRITIFKEALTMVRDEAWCGVGAGQFAQVFPQYRERSAAANEARCLHPESDWLWLVADIGWPATGCLVAAVVVVFTTAIRRSWHSGARALRMGGLVAALLLCLHGTVDVPGHRVGLAWAALLLAALAFRPYRHQDPSSDPPASERVRIGWRVVGLVPLLAGLALLQAEWRGSPVLPSAAVHRLQTEAQALYEADQAAYEQATASGRDYQPPPSDDPLEAALDRINQALRITPLDPHLHQVRGALALHFDDKPTIAKEAFAIQRRLLPGRVNLVIEQAHSWLASDPQQSLVLWREALRRAAAEETRFSGTPYGVANTYQRILQTTGRDEKLAVLTLSLAGQDPALLMPWARGAASPALLDREMPLLIPAVTVPESRRALFEVWRSRGSKEAAAAFANRQPELLLLER